MRIFPLFVLFVTNIILCAATPLDEAKQFFNTYTNLHGKFDPALADLYADDAVVKNTRNSGKAFPGELVVSGSDYKHWLRNSAPNRKLGVPSAFSDAGYTQMEGKVLLTCVLSDAELKKVSQLTLLIEKRGEKWLIVEHFMESRDVRPLPEG